MKSIRDIAVQRVLVVDDNIDSANVLGQLLSLQGLEVTVAYDGIEALQLYGKVKPDLAILDLDLPGMDGMQLAEQFRAGRHIRCPLLIAVSGYGRPEDIALCTEAGFDYHFRKPLEIERLIDLIAEYRPLPLSGATENG